MRLFTAIDLPEPVIEQLKAARPGIEGIRWQKPDQWHLTLRFIGEVAEETAQAIVSELESIECPAFSLALSGFGKFPSRGYPRVFWVGIEENGQLLTLQEELEQACRICGLEPDERPFVPHITLGKVKNAEKKEINHFIEQHEDYHIPGIPVNEFILYSSELTREGAIHKVEQSFPLRN